MLFLLKPINIQNKGFLRRIFGGLKPKLIYESIENTDICIIEAPIKNANINWRSVYCISGQDILLIPQYLDPPSELGIPKYNSYKFKLQIICNTVLKILKQSKVPPREMKICFFDPDGKLPGYAVHLLKFAGTVEVITYNRNAYATHEKKVIEDFGTDLILTDKAPSVCKFNLLFSPFENEIFINDIFNKYSLDETEHLLPKKYSSILPIGISEYELCSALYEAENKKSLDKITAKHLIKNGQTVYTKNLILSNKKD